MNVKQDLYQKKKILGLTDEQITEIDKQRYTDKISDAQIEAAQPEGEGGGEEAAAAGGEEAPAGGEEAAPEEAPGEEAPAEEPVTAGNDDADDAEIDASLLLSADDGAPRRGIPIKPQQNIQRMKYNASRRRVQKHMPDFGNMVKPNSDPFDKSWLKNPLSENEASPTKPSYDMLNMLKKMSDKLGMNGHPANRGILREELELPEDYLLKDSDDEGMGD